jgi:hypothetical protein
MLQMSNFQPGAHCHFVKMKQSTANFSPSFQPGAHCHFVKMKQSTANFSPSFQPGAHYHFVKIKQPTANLPPPPHEINKQRRKKLNFVSAVAVSSIATSCFDVSLCS